jgi:hypothetical protein
MNTFDILPRQEAPTSGWSVEYSFLKAVEDAALADYGESVHLEGVEAVLMAAFDALAVYFPPGRAAGPQEQ